MVTGAFAGRRGRGRDGRSRRWAACAALLALLAAAAGAGLAAAQETPAPAEEDPAARAPGDADAGAKGAAPDEEKKESFSKAVGRIFGDALSAPLDWVDPDKDPAAVCVAAASVEPLEDEVIQRLAEAIDAAWRPEAEGLAADTPQIVLELCVGGAGASFERPRLLRPIGGLTPEQSIALLRALDVIEKASPFVGRPEAYEPWRRVIVVFDPSLATIPDDESPKVDPTIEIVPDVSDPAAGAPEEAAGGAAAPE